MSELNLSRQSKLVPNDAITSFRYEVFGVGSLGSHIVELLAKIGATDIKVYDMDTVDEENIGPQAFQLKHIGMDKVDAMAEKVKESTGLDIEVAHGEITKETELIPDGRVIYICVFDSLSARKIVWNKVKDYPCVFVDGRIGRTHMHSFLIDTVAEGMNEMYEKTFPKEDGEGSDLVCGEKASAFINFQICSYMVANIINYVSGDTYEKCSYRDAKDHRTDIVTYVERVAPQSDDGSSEVSE